MPEKSFDAKEIADTIISDAKESRASDIHLECFEKEASVRIRIDGVLKKVRTMTPGEYKAVCDQIKVWAGMDISETHRPQDSRWILEHDSTAYDIRVSTILSTFGETIVMRLLPRSSATLLTMDRLGLGDEQLDILKSWIKRPNGVIFVTGPTGSGTTTVLYSVLNELKRESIKIISIEDPVEYAIEGIVQIPINPKLGLTFGATLRVCLRQDPDVVMVGEIRDLETLELVTQTALTGHLVLSTLHTNNATEGVIRIRDIGIEPWLIKSMLIGVMSQRLVRRLCDTCKEAYAPDPSGVSAIGLKASQYYRPKGCDLCSSTGYRGRTAIYEFFEMSDAARDLMLGGCDGSDLRRSAISGGMKTMWQDGLEKAAQGTTSIEEVMRVTAPD